MASLTLTETLHLSATIVKIPLAITDRRFCKIIFRSLEINLKAVRCSNIFL